MNEQVNRSLLLQIPRAAGKVIQGRAGVRGLSSELRGADQEKLH